MCVTGVCERGLNMYVAEVCERRGMTGNVRTYMDGAHALNTNASFQHDQ